MKIVALIDGDRQLDVVENILRQCPDSESGWKEPNEGGPLRLAIPSPRD